MSGILNRMCVKNVDEFVRLRWQIYPDIVNGNTVKWSVGTLRSTGGTLWRCLGLSGLYSVSLMAELSALSELSICPHCLHHM
mgnify:CR=1 FL=1